MKMFFLLIQVLLVANFSFGQPTGLNSTQTNRREVWGDHDKVHYLANYLEPKVDTLEIGYSYDLCICPKWFIVGKFEKIWIESQMDSILTNYSDSEAGQKKVKVIGQFYKYKGVPVALYDYGYLSEKSVPNARIFKVEKELGK